MTTVEMHAIVKGRVQGVGFRLTTQMFAREFGVVGTVKNLPDGSVEIYGQGEKQELESLVERLESYFDLDHELSSRVEFRDVGAPFSGFRVVY